MFGKRDCAFAGFEKLWQHAESAWINRGTNQWMVQSLIQTVFRPERPCQGWRSLEKPSAIPLETSKNQIVLPWLFQNGRKTQKVTFEESKVLEYCVRNWGFTQTGELTAEKDLSVYSEMPEIVANHQGLSREAIGEIRKKTDRAKLYLQMVLEQIEMAHGNCSELYIEEIQKDIERLPDEIEDLIENA